VIDATTANAAITLANPYWIALIAVLGTVVGAVISSVTQALTSRRSAADQLASLELQMDHGTQEAIRQDRRRAYTRFLSAMEQWNLLYIAVYNAVKAEHKPPARHVLWKEFVAARSEVNLLAGEEVARFARRIFRQYVESMEDAIKGNNPDKGHAEGLVFPSMLLAAMQKELDIPGIPIDPTTGFFTQDRDLGKPQNEPGSEIDPSAQKEPSS
jgi:hypothetical protein